MRVEEEVPGRTKGRGREVTGEYLGWLRDGASPTSLWMVESACLIFKEEMGCHERAKSDITLKGK